jgi:hypothetical protein
MNEDSKGGHQQWCSNVVLNGREDGTVCDGVKHQVDQNLCVRLVYSSDVYI